MATQVIKKNKKKNPLKWEKSGGISQEHGTAESDRITTEKVRKRQRNKTSSKLLQTKEANGGFGPSDKISDPGRVNAEPGNMETT